MCDFGVCGKGRDRQKSFHVRAERDALLLHALVSVGA